MMLVYLQAWSIRCCLGELWASMARPRAVFCSLAAAGADRSYLGLQLTQPSSELARCIFVYLLLSYSVVTRCYVSILMCFASLQLQASVLRPLASAAAAAESAESTGTHKA